MGSKSNNTKNVASGSNTLGKSGSTVLGKTKYSPFIVARELVPIFEPTLLAISKFIDQCTLADSLVEDSQKSLLLALIRNKIPDKCYGRLTSNSEFKSISELVKQIKETYIPDFNFVKYHKKFERMERDSGETLEEFGERIMETLNVSVVAARLGKRKTPKSLNLTKYWPTTSAVSNFWAGLGKLSIPSVMIQNHELDESDLNAAIKLASRFDRIQDNGNGECKE